MNTGRGAHFFFAYMDKTKFKKNAFNWVANDEDYLLVFRQVDDLWREISGNLPKYNNIVLADYLNQVGVIVPDDCTFCRIERYEDDGRKFYWELRAHGGLIYIYFELK